MKRIWNSELAQHVGERVRLTGWVHTLRMLGKVNFLLLRDASGISQVFIEKSELSQLQDSLPESVIEVEGDVAAEPQAPGGYELHHPKITVISRVTEALPFPINKPDLDVRLDTFLNHAPVGLRHPKRQATFRIAAGVMAGFRKYLDGQRFVEITSPKIVASATESGANVFAINYFGSQAYLAQSPQFYKQMMVGVFERVYEIGPVFRAEPHSTVRHTNEFVSLDVEMGFIDGPVDVMRMLDGTVNAILTYLQERYGDALALLEVELPQAPECFPSIHFADAQQLIYERYGEDCRGEPDLAPQHERWICEWGKETYASDFIYVTGYPMSKRPFYTHPDPANPQYSNSFDLLFRGTEMVTGGQRLHRYEDYLAALAAYNLSPEPFEGYLEAFRYGMPPHGGFAIGMERMVMLLIGARNLRETVLFPRDLSRVTP